MQYVCSSPHVNCRPMRLNVRRIMRAGSVEPRMKGVPAHSAAALRAITASLRAKVTESALRLWVGDRWLRSRMEYKMLVRTDWWGSS